MKYRLKDRELQRKLDELSDGDFSKQLALNYKRICSDLEFLMQITLWFCKREGPAPRVSDNARHGRKG